MLLDYYSHINKHREVKLRVFIPIINIPNFKTELSPSLRNLEYWNNGVLE